MNDTADTYILRDDLSFHNHRELIDKMNKYPFSINWGNVSLIVINVRFQYWLVILRKRV